MTLVQVIQNIVHFVKSPCNFIIVPIITPYYSFPFRNDFQYVYLLNGLPILNIGSTTGIWLSCSQTIGICGYSNDASQATKFYITQSSSDAYQLQVFDSSLLLKNSNRVMSISSSPASSTDSGFKWTRSLTNCQLNNNQFYWNSDSIQISTIQ
jgi:hypothetical protein